MHAQTRPMGLVRATTATDKLPYDGRSCEHEKSMKRTKLELLGSHTHTYARLKWPQLDQQLRQHRRREKKRFRNNLIITKYLDILRLHLPNLLLLLLLLQFCAFFERSSFSAEPHNGMAANGERTSEQKMLCFSYDHIVNVPVRVSVLLCIPCAQFQRYHADTRWKLVCRCVLLRAATRQRTMLCGKMMCTEKILQPDRARRTDTCRLCA